MKKKTVAWGCSGVLIDPSASECLETLQVMNSSGANAVVVFDVGNGEIKNETLMVIAHKPVFNVSDPWEHVHPWFYSWVDGTFMPANIVNSSLPTVGAKCLEAVEVDGRHFLIICQSGACRPNRVGGPVAMKDEDAEFVSGGACTVVYEWSLDVYGSFHISISMCKRLILD